MTKRNDLIARVLLAGAVVILAVVRAAWHSQLSGRMDSLFFVLLGAAAVLLLVPIQRLKSLGILAIDNDFDLIVTDVQRLGESYRLNNGIEIHEGVNFIVKLRNSHPDQVVRMIPVIFYAAYPSERLIRFTRPARETYPPPEIANSVTDLAPKVVKLLAEARSAPIAAGERKKATSARDKDAELSDWKDQVPEDMG